MKPAAAIAARSAARTGARLGAAASRGATARRGYNSGLISVGAFTCRRGMVRLATDSASTATPIRLRVAGSGTLADPPNGQLSTATLPSVVNPDVAALRLLLYDKFGLILRIETTVNDLPFSSTTAR